MVAEMFVKSRMNRIINSTMKDKVEIFQDVLNENQRKQLVGFRHTSN